jgi:iron(III) transport system ATP-binding protein
MTARSVIRIRQLEKVFPTSRGPVRAVRGIDLDVAEGEFVVLLGPSGCGKTTTLRCVAGLERPDGGEIELDGDLVDSPAQRRFVPPERRDIGMVFQSYAIWPHLNVFDNIALPLTEGRRRQSRDEVRARVLEALRLVRLDGFESRPATDLSGGQQQRVALARAIVTRPKVLLMDEPLSNLDARLRDSMRTELKRLTLELGVTTLYVTHDQIEALSLGDRICVMRDGVILQQGPPEEVYNRPADAFVAQFVGDMNFVPGTVSRNGTTEVHTPFGAVQCQVEGDFRDGEAVTLAMRPEHIEPAVGATDEVVEGRLVTRLFIGDSAVWHVDANGVPLMAKVRGSERAQPNQTVRLLMPRERWHVFKGAQTVSEEALAPD